MATSSPRSIPLTPIQRRFFGFDLRNPHHFNQAVLLEAKVPLKRRLLEQAVDHLARHHEALRLRYLPHDGGWSQIDGGEEAVGGAFAFVDLTSDQRTPGDVFAALQGSLHLTRGPVYRVALVHRGPALSARLLVVVHHLVSDRLSLDLLLADLQTAYGCLARGLPPQLPPATAPFSAWAEHLAGRAAADDLQQELEFWRPPDDARAVSCGPPPEMPAGANQVDSAVTHTLKFGAEESAPFLELGDDRLRAVLLAAFGLACRETWGASSLVVDLRASTRPAAPPELALDRTLGWFTASFPLLLETADSGIGAAAFDTLFRRVAQRLRDLPNHGLGYGLLREMGGNGNFRKLLEGIPASRMSFNFIGHFRSPPPADAPIMPAPEPVGPTSCPDNERPYDLEVMAFALHGRLRCEWTYGRHRYRATTVEDLASRFRHHLALPAELPADRGTIP